MIFAIVCGMGDGVDRVHRCTRLVEALQARGHDARLEQIAVLPEGDEPIPGVPYRLNQPILSPSQPTVIFRDVGRSPATSWWSLGEPPGRPSASVAYHDDGESAKKHAHAIVNDDLEPNELVPLLEKLADDVEKATRMLEAHESRILNS